MVRVPTPEQEDRRRLCRERKTLIVERVQHVNRIKGLLFSQGVGDYRPLRRDRRQALEALRSGDGRELDAHLKTQITRELDRLELLLDQIAAVEAERDAMLAQEAERTGVVAGAPEAPAPIKALLDINGVAEETAAVLWTEALCRKFQNRRQIAGFAGLAGSPFQSGSINREQGLSKSGSSRVRTAMLELAWGWLVHQRDCALTRWYRERTAGAGAIVRKKMIVALARKLLVALWKYVNDGVVIEGVLLKSAKLAGGKLAGGESKAGKSKAGKSKAGKSRRGNRERAAGPRPSAPAPACA
jgi:transposase